MLGSFIRHGLTQEEAAGEVLLQVVAGSDTSAGTVRAVMLNVVTNACIYKKLQTEIDSSIKAGQISSPITDAEARRMPYLQAVIRKVSASTHLLQEPCSSKYRQVETLSTVNSCLEVHRLEPHL